MKKYYNYYDFDRCKRFQRKSDRCDHYEVVSVGSVACKEYCFYCKGYDDKNDDINKNYVVCEIINKDNIRKFLDEL